MLRESPFLTPGTLPKRLDGCNRESPMPGKPLPGSGRTSVKPRPAKKPKPQAVPSKAALTDPSQPPSEALAERRRAVFFFAALIVVLCLAWMTWCAFGVPKYRL
jgi:hypothetical protein